MADTDILLSVDLDIKDAEKTAEQLQKEVKSIFDSDRGQKSAAQTSLEMQMKQTYDKISQLTSKMREIGDTPVATQRFAELTSQLDKYENKYYALIQKMSQFEEAGGDVSSTKYQQWALEFERMEASLGTIHTEMEKMQKDGTAFVSGNETEEYKKLQAELDKTNDKLKQQLIKYNEIENKGARGVDKTTRSMQRLGQATDRVRKSSAQMSTNFSTGFKNVNKNITKMIGKFAMLFLGVRGLYSVVMKIRSAIMEGFKNLRTSGVGKLKQQMQDLTNASTTLKNALAGAFEPIVTSIIPHIQRLIEWLTAAIDKLAQFIAAMKGQTTYIKAIKQVGNAGEKAKKQLAGFDELNVLNKQSGNGAAGMFEEAKIADEMIDRVAKLKEKIKEIHDWLEKHIFGPVKAFLAWLARPITDNLDRIKEALANFKRHLEPWIQWIQEKIQHIRDVINEVWETYIKPSLDRIMDFVSYFFGKILDFYNKHSDEFAWFGQQFRAIWDESVQPVIDEAIRWFGSLFNLITSFLNTGYIDRLFAGLEMIWNWAYPHLQQGILVIRYLAKVISDSIVDTMRNTRRMFDFIALCLQKTGSAWTTFKIVVHLVFDSIKERFNQLREDIYTITHYGQEEFGVLIYLFKSPFVAAIDLVKYAFECLKQAVSDVIATVKDLVGIDLTSSPVLQLIDKVSGLQTTSTKSTSTRKHKIKGMASGGVIPPTASEHLVMVGDNHQETEVVSPLSTMQEAMINALQQVGFGGNGQPINIYLGTDKIYSEIRKLEKRNIVMGG